MRSSSPAAGSTSCCTSYKAANGEALGSGAFAGLYADALLLGIQAMVDCGCTDPAEIGAAVAEITGFNGFTGEMGYAGTNGVPDKPVSIHQIVDGSGHARRQLGSVTDVLDAVGLTTRYGSIAALRDADLRRRRR